MQPGMPIAFGMAVPPQAAVTPLPMNAGDSDAIESEWVDAIKQTVATYKDDPYKLAVAISQLRADYLKKRYNKEIKVLG